MTYDEMWEELRKEFPDAMEQVEQTCELYKQYKARGYSEKRAWRVARRQVKTHQLWRSKNET